MRAAHLTAYGQAPRLVDVSAPARRPGESLIATTAVPITPLDVLCATGRSYFGEPPLPYVPGVQGVGVVLESERVEPGTRVWFPTTAGMSPGDGSLAEQAVALDLDLVELPDGVPDELVAALGLSAVAAWQSLTWRGGLRPDERVLVLGAGGVVGQVAVQAARLLGASRVVAAARSLEARELALSYAADDVVEIRPDDDVVTLTARLRSACQGAVDLVIDPLCGVPGSAAVELLGEGGRLVNLGGSAGTTAQFSSASLRSRSASILGYTNNALTADQRRDAFAAVLDEATRGRLTVSHEVVDWPSGPDGWARQAADRTRRRVVVRV